MRLDKVFFQNLLHLQDGLRLQLSKGITVLLGANNTGKSNILRLVSQIEKPWPKAVQSLKTVASKPAWIRAHFKDFNIKDIERFERCLTKYNVPKLQSTVHLEKQYSEIWSLVTAITESGSRSELVQRTGERIKEIVGQLNHSHFANLRREDQHEPVEVEPLAADEIVLLRTDQGLSLISDCLGDLLFPDRENRLHKIEAWSSDGSRGKEIRSAIAPAIGFLKDVAQIRKGQRVITFVPASQILEKPESSFLLAAYLEEESLIVSQDRFHGEGDTSVARMLRKFYGGQNDDMTNLSLAVTKLLQERIGQMKFPVLADFDFDVEFGTDRTTIKFRPKGGSLSLPLSSASSGVKWLFMLFLNMLQFGGQLPDLLLLDEPGNNLHPAVQKQLVLAFEEIQKDVQLVYCSHSVFMLNPNRVLDIRLVKRPDTLTEIEHKPYQNRFLQITLALGLNLLRPYFVLEKGERILFVEGVSDVIIFTGISQILFHLGRTSLNLADTAVLAAERTGNPKSVVREAQALVADLKAPKIVLIADGDTPGRDLANAFESAGYPAKHLTDLLGDEKVRTSEDLIPLEIYLDAVKAIHIFDPSPFVDKLANPILDCFSNLELDTLMDNKPQVARVAVERTMDKLIEGESASNFEDTLAKWEKIFKWLTEEGFK